MPCCDGVILLTPFISIQEWNYGSVGFFWVELWFVGLSYG